MDYATFLERAVLARADLPVRVRMGNGQLREVGDVLLADEFDEVDGETDTEGKPLRHHRITALIIAVE